MDPFDNIYVVDKRPFSFFSPPILKFSGNGTFIKYNVINNQTTGTGINHVPKDIATDSHGNLYVLNNFPISCFSSFSSNGLSFSYCNGGSVQKFSSEGVFVSSIINASRGPDGIEIFPENMDVDSFDNVYITDASSNQIFVLAPNKTSAIPFN